MSLHAFSSLRNRLLLLVLFAVLPPFGLIVYSTIEHRRSAIVEAENDAHHFKLHLLAD